LSSPFWHCIKNNNKTQQVLSIANGGAGPHRQKQGNEPLRIVVTSRMMGDTSADESDTCTPPTVQSLQERIQRLEEENSRLRSCLSHASASNGIAGNGNIQTNKELLAGPSTSASLSSTTTTTTTIEETTTAEGTDNNPSSASFAQHSLSRDEIERYSRQLLLRDGFGVAGQHKLSSSSVLIVGAGGIGSTGTFAGVQKCCLIRICVLCRSLWSVFTYSYTSITTIPVVLISHTCLGKRIISRTPPQSHIIPGSMWCRKINHCRF
jgi:hypothetical protein